MRFAHFLVALEQQTFDEQLARQLAQRSCIKTARHTRPTARHAQQDKLGNDIMVFVSCLTFFKKETKLVAQLVCVPLMSPVSAQYLRALSHSCSSVTANNIPTHVSPCSFHKCEFGYVRKKKQNDKNVIYIPPVRGCRMRSAASFHWPCSSAMPTRCVATDPVPKRCRPKRAREPA